MLSNYAVPLPPQLVFDTPADWQASLLNHTRMALGLERSLAASLNDPCRPIVLSEARQLLDFAEQNTRRAHALQQALGDMADVDKWAELAMTIEGIWRGIVLAMRKVIAHFDAVRASRSQAQPAAAPAVPAHDAGAPARPDDKTEASRPHPVRHPMAHTGIAPKRQAA